MWFGWDDTPWASKVIIASTDAEGGEEEGMEDILGAKAEVRRLERRRGCQVVVIESGKFLGEAI